MRPRDFDGPDDPEEIDRYLARIRKWEEDQAQLVTQLNEARAALDEADARRVRLDGWVRRLRHTATATAQAAAAVQAADAELATVAAELVDVQSELDEHAQARDIATARLLGGPAVTRPLVLLPVRLETRWDGGTLDVRIIPDTIGVTGHDPTLTADESAWGAHYWAARTGATAADPEQTWHQLTRRFGPQRAAWIVHATAAGAPAAPDIRDSPWPAPPEARLLSARFAVVAFADGEPVDVGEPANPRFVTWGRPVAQHLVCGPLAADETAAWLTDLSAAREAGMAVSIAVPPDRPPIETLVVVGVRTDPVDLAALLDAHAYSVGVELLADGTPTNNSDALRAGHSPQRDEAVARVLRDRALPDLASPDPPAEGTAGAQAATLLGLPAAALAYVAGADTARAGPVAAMRLLVGLAAEGAMRSELAPLEGGEIWPLVEPGGPGPTLRVGRQPYGLLPVTAPRRWQPADGEVGAPFAAALHRWAAATGPASATDPAAAPQPIGGGPARQVTRDDDSALPELLMEAASGIRWQDGDAVFEGLTGITGDADGPHAPSGYLALIAATDSADLDGLPEDALPPALLCRIALTAKRRADPRTIIAVDIALTALAQQPRDHLARLLGELLDTVSHRFDPWLTAAVTARLTTLRGRTDAEPAVGAFGWVTDLRPRGDDRSYGHIHAPSLAHAATAAVLRSGYLGQRRQAWSQRLAAARAEFADAEADLLAVEADRDSGAPGWPVRLGQAGRRVTQSRRRLETADKGLRDLTPLEPAAENRLPLAVDLSSRRVRAARWVLAAVRSGQPLGAVLGYQFERDLADAGLSAYLAAFRKLSRFRTGSALEALEDARDRARAALVAARAELVALQARAEALQGPLAVAAGRVTEAAVRVTAAEAAAAPYLQMQRDLRVLDESTVVQAQARLAEIDGRKPAVSTRTRRIRIPVPD